MRIIYDVLAQLNLIHSVRLANSGELPEALTAVERALAARPGWDDAESARSELTKMMNDIQERMKAVESEIRTSSNETLNEAGERMQRQARIGFGPAHSYASSERARQITTLAGQARARRFWNRLGLSEPDAS
jgi:uncharacterized protein with PIN domain